MKRKIFSTLFALVLLAGLSLVMAAPAAAGAATGGKVTFEFHASDLLDVYPDSYASESVGTERYDGQLNARGLRDRTGPLWQYNTFSGEDSYNAYLNWRDGIGSGEGISAFNIWLFDEPIAKAWGETIVMKTGAPVSATCPEGWNIQYVPDPYALTGYIIEFYTTDPAKYLRPGEDQGVFSFTVDVYHDEGNPNWDEGDPPVEVGDICRLWFGSAVYENTSGVTLDPPFHSGFVFDNLGWGTLSPATVTNSPGVFPSSEYKMGGTYVEHLLQFDAVLDLEAKAETSSVIIPANDTDSTETTNAYIEATTGTGGPATIKVTEYTDLPEGEPVFGALGTYVDVHCDTPENLTGVIIEVNYDPAITGVEESALRVSYWNSVVGDWRQCSDQVVFPGVDYIEVTINDTTTPDLSYLATSIFGLNGITLELDDWHSSDATVDVTIADAGKSGVIAAFAWSDTVGEPNKITIALNETGTGTGVFEGSFDLVSTTPGAGELLVNDGDVITVEYLVGAEWLLGTATVDDTAPVVTITAPEDGDFVAGVVDIEGTVDEADLDTWSLEIGGEGFTTGSGGVVIVPWDTTFVIPESDPAEALWPDGSYTIELLGQDLAGNSGSSGSIEVTVDNTLPVITLQVAEPPVITPDEETPVVFTATVIDVNIDTVTIDLSDVGGATAEPMLDDGEGDDVAAGDDIYTASENITESIEGNYALTVTATDEVANSDTADVNLSVALDTVKPVITSPTITYEYGSSARPGETVIISAIVTDEPDGLIEVVEATCSELTDSPIALLDGDDIYTGTAEVSLTAVAGDYTITITATDDSGNPATPVTLTLTVDPAATGSLIILADGWNLISLPLIPTDGSIDVVLADISDNVSQLRTWVYEAGVLVEKVWINDGPADFTEMGAGKGYWIEMTEANVLIATGVVLPAPPQAPPSYIVYEGWNLIGFKSVNTTLVEEYLGDAVVANFERMYGYDVVVGLYTVIQPGIDELKPGQGYWLAVSAEGTIYP